MDWPFLHRLVLFPDAAKLFSVSDLGHLFMVHRPFRLSEIMVTMNRYKLEPKRMRLVYPYVDREPNMVLIEATRLLHRCV